MGFIRHTIIGIIVYISEPKTTTADIQRFTTKGHLPLHVPLSKGYSLKVAPQQSFLRFTFAIQRQVLIIL